MNELTDPRLFKESDIYLAPLCLLILMIIAYKARAKYRGTEIERYFFPGLILRFIFSIFFALVIQFYYGYGDTFMYYRATQDMHRAVSDDFANLFVLLRSTKLFPTHPLYAYFMYDGGAYTDLYMRIPNNFSVPKFALPFSLAFSKSYMCISFCICLFSFAGCWRMFKAFYFLYPALRQKIAIAVLFLPSVLFWGQGLSKDSICIGALGFVVHSLYKIFIVKKKTMISVLLLVINAYLLISIKSYILLAFAAAFAIALFLTLNKKIENRYLRIASMFIFVGGALTAGFFLINTLTSFESSSQFAVDNILQTVQGVQSGYEAVAGEGSYFTVGEVDNSLGSVISLFPLGVITTLFRPLLWEVRNPLMLFSAAEALLFLVMTIMILRKVGVRKSIGIILSNPVALLCLFFTLIFAGFVGITTSNFGSLARYKIPCLPFYLMTLFILMHQSGKFKKGYIFSKRFL